MSKIAGIIAEFNPFHNGHALLIRRLRNMGFEYIVAVMSPDFVQRGEPAIADAYTRAKMALLSGADLVISMPVHYAVSAAGSFARGGVRLLDALGCVTHLAFGCEDPDLRHLKQAAEIMAEEPPAYRDALLCALSGGTPWPAARSAALLAQDPSFPADLMEKPNNTLAVEYLRAMIDNSSAMIPFPVQREGSGYHESTIPQSAKGPVLPSASALRRYIRSQLKICDNGVDAVLSSCIPSGSLSCLRDALNYGNTWSPEIYDSILGTALVRRFGIGTAVPESDLDRRIRNLLPRFGNAEEFALLVKNRSVTLTHVRRRLLNILLELPEGSDALPPAYIRVLGLRRESSPLLAMIREKTKLPIITKPAAAPALLKDPAALQTFEEDLRSSQIYRQLSPRLGQNLTGSGYTRSPIII